MRSSIACFFTAVALATAQPSAMPVETRQAILDYQLTMPRANQLITAMEAMTKYVMSLPDAMERLQAAKKRTPSEQAAKVESDPKAMAILKQNNLTAKDYVVGVPALRMALMAAQGASTVSSPANLAFAKQHFAELKPKMDAADGIAPRKP
jgi:hypothetical protein